MVKEKSIKDVKKFCKRYYNVGENNGNWNGGRSYTSTGYQRILMPTHHASDYNGYVLEHRFVYEQHHNCCILPWIECHHIDEHPENNRIENLQLLTKSDHAKVHRGIPINRECTKCGSANTSMHKARNGKYYPQWYKDPNNIIVCSKCFEKYYRKKRLR